MAQNGNTKLKIDIAILTEQMAQITDDIREIKENHLDHIYSRLGKIDNKIAYWSGGIVVATTLINWILSTQ